MSQNICGTCVKLSAFLTLESRVLLLLFHIASRGGLYVARGHAKQIAGRRDVDDRILQRSKLAGRSPPATPFPVELNRTDRVTPLRCNGLDRGQRPCRIKQMYADSIPKTHFLLCPADGPISQ